MMRRVMLVCLASSVLFASPLRAAEPLRLAKNEPPIWGEEPEPEPAKPRPAAARAPRAPLPPGRSRLFWQLDYFSRDSAYKEDKRAVAAFVEEAVDSGFYHSSQGTLRVSGGLGFRFGLFLPALWGIELGPSAGYVLGPAEKISVDAQSSSVGQGRFIGRAETDYIRVMLEAAKEVPASRRTRLRLRLAGGLARGRITEKDEYSGSFLTTVNGARPSMKSSHSWTGFTWELMQSLLVRGGAVDFELGLGFAGFPAMKENDDFNRFEWEPLALRVGVEFK